MSPIRMSLIVAGCTAAAVAASQAPSQPARFRVAVYYVIGYEPDRDTFAPKGKPPLLHTIAVNVKRAGLRVRARKQFIGVSDPEWRSGAPTPAQSSTEKRWGDSTEACPRIHPARRRDAIPVGAQRQALKGTGPHRAVDESMGWRYRLGQDEVPGYC